MKSPNSLGGMRLLPAAIRKYPLKIYKSVYNNPLYLYKFT